METTLTQEQTTTEVITPEVVAIVPRIIKPESRMAKRM